MDADKSLELTDREIAQFFSDPKIAEKFPPFLTLSAAAELLQVPDGTLRDWRSRGLLADCARKVGKEVRFVRDRLIKHVFNNGLSK